MFAPQSQASLISEAKLNPTTAIVYRSKPGQHFVVFVAAFVVFVAAYAPRGSLYAHVR
jgi:hypothetical protein